MKTFQINIQTLLFITDNSVLGAYNENTKILVYNKPIVKEDKLNEMIGFLKGRNKEVTSTFQSDSFGINFYDHTTGGTSTFHEVKDKSKEFSSTSKDYEFVNDFSNKVICRPFTTDTYNGIEIFVEGERLGSMIDELPDTTDNDEVVDFETRVTDWIVENE